MDSSTKDYIYHHVIPIIQQGKAALFLGAGFSTGTKLKAGGKLPSSEELIEAICQQANVPIEERKDMDLKDAFDIGEDEIPDFPGFLKQHFIVDKPLAWQNGLLQHRWRIIFTTNIDTIPQSCTEILKRSDAAKCPKYRFYNFRDRQPATKIPIETPIVFLHGMIERVDEGIIFNDVAFADTTVRPGDWFPEAASQIMAGNCLLIGSRFKEPDIQAAIKTRELETNPCASQENWIVLRSFKQTDARIYKKRGLIPIQADAKDFAEYINSNLYTLTHYQFIKQQLPHILFDERQSVAGSWFADAFDHVATQISNQSARKGVFSRFYYGDMPSWFYIAHDTPAHFSIANKIVDKILRIEKGDPTEHLLIVEGSVCTGKTTACMQALKSLSISRHAIYTYKSEDGIQIDLLWRTIKDTKGTLILYFDNSSEWFYVFNELIIRSKNLRGNRKLIILAETRSNDFKANKRHLIDIPPESFYEIKAPNIVSADATALLDKLDQLEIKFPQLHGLDRNTAIKKIVDFERGFRGDLLATVCSLASVDPYKTKLDAEYSSISDQLAKKIFLLLALVTSVKHSVPVGYIAEYCGHSVSKIYSCIQEELQGAARWSSDGKHVSLRHSVIAHYHVKTSFNDSLICDAIIRLMEVVGKKFTVNDIKSHPLPYRIYRDLLSCYYLADEIFTNKSDYHFIESIYSHCQSYFSGDGMFWLQFGRLYDRLDRIDDAIHCFERGLSVYTSFQTQHALGHLLLKKFIATKMLDNELFDRGVGLLEDEIKSRGVNDSYPATTLIEMFILILQRKFTDDLYDRTRAIINANMRHISDKTFAKMVHTFIKLCEKYGKKYTAA